MSLVTVAINAHREGELLLRTLSALEQTLLYTRSKGISVDVILIADKADQKTIDIISEKKSFFTNISYVEFGDLGDSRNSAVNLCKTEFLTFLDGDDFLSLSWLEQCLNLYRNEGYDKVFLHPEKVISFGSKLRYWHQISQLNQEFDNSCFFEFNPYASISFSLTENYKSIPYRNNSKSIGFAFEDWLWNVDTVAAGFQHHTVSGSHFFYRRKQDNSLSVSQYSVNGCIHSSEFFEKSDLMLRKGFSANENTWLKYFEINFDEKLMNEMKRLSEIEPLIRYDKQTLSQYSARVITRSVLPQYYLILKDNIKQYSKVIISDHFKKLEKSECLLLTSNENTSDQNENVIPFESMCYEFSSDQKLLILLRLFLQSPGIEIKVIDSRLGLDLLNKFQKQLSNYVSVSGKEISIEK